MNARILAENAVPIIRPTTNLCAKYKAFKMPVYDYPNPYTSNNIHSVSDDKPFVNSAIEGQHNGVVDPHQQHVYFTSRAVDVI